MTLRDGEELKVAAGQRSINRQVAMWFAFSYEADIGLTGEIKMHCGKQIV